MTILIKCSGKNTNNLAPNIFQNLFKQECLKEGHSIMQLQFIGNEIALAVVMR